MIMCRSCVDGGRAHSDPPLFEHVWNVDEMFRGTDCRREMNMYKLQSSGVVIIVPECYALQRVAEMNSGVSM